jgi:hypothetical protein
MKLGKPINRLIHTTMCSVYDVGINESYQKVSHISTWRLMNYLVRNEVMKSVSVGVSTIIWRSVYGTR